MKFNADHLKRMTVADLKNLEQNISMWFHLKDRQKSVAATALGLRKSFTHKPCSFTFQGASKLSERHSKAVFDCKESFSSLSSAVKAFLPNGGVNMPGVNADTQKRVNLEVALRKRYSVLSPKLDKSETGIIRRECSSPKKLLSELRKPQQANLLPSQVSPLRNGLNDAAAEKCPVTEDQKKTDVNANTVSKRLLPACLTPNKPKRLSKSIPLRKIVILREHHKKCENRIKHLEEKTARLRLQKSKLEQKCTANKL
uniref:Uncharacterized protein LOC100175578 n=1 Tax=Phallusia mammillata TaxID=59560 RepID=A0A6F9DH23_9ASCI|nr:uncharacterized protein LOC100175578 [Phallusia mammillata]